MAWFGGKVSLGSFPDLAGAVNKLSESVKNIEKNFDTALGFEERSHSTGEGIWTSGADRKTLFEPVVTFEGQKGETSSESLGPPVLTHSEDNEPGSLVSDSGTLRPSPESGSPTPASETLLPDIRNEASVVNDENHDISMDAEISITADVVKSESDSPVHSAEVLQQIDKHVSHVEPFDHKAENNSEVSPSEDSRFSEQSSEIIETDRNEDRGSSPELQNVDTGESGDGDGTAEEIAVDDSSGVDAPSSPSQVGDHVEPPPVDSFRMETRGGGEIQDGLSNSFQLDGTSSIKHEDGATVEEIKLIKASSTYEFSDSKHVFTSDSSTMDGTAVSELEKARSEMKMMEIALQGAARQAQAKADEIAKMMNENEELKSSIEDLKRKANEETEALREEYRQRVTTLERKVYALTKERDVLRREQNKKSDAAALLKEKDEIISQVMAEGEELSKKQAFQESQIRKLRAQVREFEEDKKGLLAKLQVEETKVENLKKDMATTEKLVQEMTEKHEAEIATQTEFYTKSLAAAKEAEALAEARANNEARTELENRLREAEEREGMLVQALEELRQTLSRREQQAIFKEDILCRDIEDLQKRYQDSERRCEELVAQVPESTRPLLRQIEAMQETTGRRAEAWAAVERSLSSRLQEAEAKAVFAEERERSVNERLSQNLSRINVLEAQISCLRTEQSQLSRSLEKERQRAAENRQEYLAAKEKADTFEGRTNQLDEELRELVRKHNEELQVSLSHKELLKQEIERERSARMDLDRAARQQISSMAVETSSLKHGNLSRKLSSSSSVGSMEESYYLQTSLDSHDSSSEHRNLGEAGTSPYYMRSMTPSSFGAALRQKEGELASYTSRLASMESIRDSLADELVKITAQYEKLRTEAAVLPGVRAELEALRRRHSSALELMGERDEELEELRADIVDLKDMYKEQVDLLVNKIQMLHTSAESPPS